MFSESRSMQDNKCEHCSVAFGLVNAINLTLKKTVNCSSVVNGLED